MYKYTTTIRSEEDLRDIITSVYLSGFRFTSSDQLVQYLQTNGVSEGVLGGANRKRVNRLFLEHHRQTLSKPLRNSSYGTYTNNVLDIHLDDVGQSHITIPLDAVILTCLGIQKDIFSFSLFKVSDTGHDIFKARRCRQRNNYMVESVARRLGMEVALSTKHQLHWYSDPTAPNIQTGTATFIVIKESAIDCQIALGTDLAITNEGWTVALPQFHSSTPGEPFSEKRFKVHKDTGPIERTQNTIVSYLENRQDIPYGHLLESVENQKKDSRSSQGFGSSSRAPLNPRRTSRSSRSQSTSRRPLIQHAGSPKTRSQSTPAHDRPLQTTLLLEQSTHHQSRREYVSYPNQQYPPQIRSPRNRMDRRKSKAHRNRDRVTVDYSDSDEARRDSKDRNPKRPKTRSENRPRAKTVETESWRVNRTIGNSVGQRKEKERDEKHRNQKRGNQVHTILLGLGCLGLLLALAIVYSANR